MDINSKQHGLAYVNGVLQDTIPPKKQIMPGRTTSLLGISSFNKDSLELARDYYQGHQFTQNNLPKYQYDSIHPVKVSMKVERRSPSVDNDSTNQYFSNLLRIRDRITDKGVLEYNEPWWYDIDLFRERIRTEHLLNSEAQKKSLVTGRHRYSESEKESNSSNIKVDIVKRRIRARSESEPNDISNMRRWNTPISINIQPNIQHDKIYKRESDQEIANRSQFSRAKPHAHSNFKRDSPPRVLIYNNPPRSPSILRKSPRFRSSPILGSPRTRRCKTKSPSPTFRAAPLITSSFRHNSPVPKRKSTTPPLRAISKSITSPKVNKNRGIKSDTDGSSLEDDDDYDFEGEIHDDDTSSDSENDYKSHVYLSSDKSFSPLHFIASQLVRIKDDPMSPFVASLFPNVPPYLRFSSHTEKGPPMPQQIHKILKWKLTTISPSVIRRILANSGIRLLKKTNEWMGTWGKHMKSPGFKTVRSYQKINHIPGSFRIGRKDSCWNNLRAQMAKHGKKEFGFMPKTYVIPQDLKLLRKAWPKYSHRDFKWIIKPPASARGTGIKVINRWSEIPKRKPVIIQRYIERPLLINGSKFDLRLYVLVTSINPLRVYIYKDGLARFASVKYSDRSDTLSDRCMHLTNYSINKLSANYAKNEDANACQGHKWTIKSLWSYFNERGINTNKLWCAIRNLILRTILAGENSIHTMVKMNVQSKYNCFELFGFDVILDSELVPWLLEVNISPSLHSELPLDLHVKAPLVQAVLNTALYNIPPKLNTEQQKEILSDHGLNGPLCFDKRIYVTHLSRAEKIKHNQFTKKSLEDRDDYLSAILENLTPDDVRCLIITEDELARSTPLERIFPGPNTYKYLKYTENPRYYNRLLDAWENRYSRNREAGIEHLRELCEQKLHLSVPPAPVRKQLKIRTRTMRISTTMIPRTSSSTATSEPTISETPGLTISRKFVTKTNHCMALITAVKSIKKRTKKQNLTRLAKNSKTTETSSSIRYQH